MELGTRIFLLFFFNYICTYVCMYVHMYMVVYVCMPLWGSEDKLQGLVFSCSLSLCLSLLPSLCIETDTFLYCMVFNSLRISYMHMILPHAPTFFSVFFFFLNNASSPICAIHKLRSMRPPTTKGHT